MVVMNFSSYYERIVSDRYIREMLFLLVGLCLFQLGLVQSELQIIIGNIDLNVNDEYLEDCEASPCENDDMLAIFSFDCTVKKTLPPEGTMKAVLMEMVNGEPTEPTGVDMDISFQQMMNDTVLVGPLFTAMGVPLVWPIEPVTMSIQCYTAPMENLPDFFPPGEYKFLFDLLYDDSHLFVLELYLTLY